MIRSPRSVVATVSGLVVLGVLLAWTRAGESRKERVEQERAVTLQQVPKPVRMTIKKQAGTNRVREIEEVNDGERTLYEAAWVQDGKEIEIRVASDGRLLGEEGQRNEAGNEAEEDEAEGADEQPETERAVTESEVPDAALATLRKLANGAKITAFAEEIEFGHTFYEGSWKGRSGSNTDVLVTAAGDLVEIEEQVGKEEVPATVLSAVRKAAGKDTELGLEKKTMVLYEAKFRKGGNLHEFLLAPDGRVVEKQMERSAAADRKAANAEDEEENEGDE